MNGNVKKVIAGICAVTMLCGMVATFPADVISNVGIGIVASADNTCGANLNWTLDDEGVLTITGTGTNIYSSAFKNNTNIKSVVFEASNLKNIGEYAFYGCTGLTSITIPSSVEKIYSYAFQGCSNLTTVIMPAENSGTKINIIDSYVFADCPKLTTFRPEGSNEAFKIPSYITSLYFSCFCNTGFTEVTIPSSVEAISEQVFKNCSSLTTVIMPAEDSGTTFNTLSEDLFNNCTKLTTFRPEDSNEAFKIPSYITAVCDACFDGTGFTEVTIPSTVTHLEGSVFEDCESLTTVIMPAEDSGTTLDKLPDSFFSNCTKLTTFRPEGSNETFKIPSYIKKIGGGCFAATKFESITIPSTVTSIGANAFAICTSLTSVEMLNPSLISSLKNDEDNPFYGDTVLATFKLGCGATEQQVKDAQTALKKQANKSVVVTKNAHVYDSSTGICVCGAHKPGGTIEGTDVEWSIEDGVLYITGSGDMPEIDSYAKEYWYADDCKDTFTKVVIGEGVTSVGDSAFLDCSKIESVTIPTTIKKIEDDAFCNCTKLENVDLSNAINLEAINEEAFCNTLITSITLPSSIKKIGDAAFYGCTNLVNVKILNPDVEVGEMSFIEDDNVVTVYTTCNATEEQCENLKSKMKTTGGATNLTAVIPLDHDYVNGVCTHCGAIAPDSVSQDHKISAGTSKVTLSTNNASVGERVYLTGVSGEKYTVRTKTGKIIATISGSGSFIMPDEEIVIDGDAVTTVLMQNAFCKPYVYAYDANMNVTNTFTTRTGNTIKLDFGKANAGKTVKICEGKKSTKTEYTTVTLDSNGKATVTVENGKNYTAVIGE